MAREMVPVLKRCRSLGLDPLYLGVDKKSNRKPGDVVEIREKFKTSQRYKDILEMAGGRMVPEWLEADQENLKGEVKALPLREQIDVPVDEMLIVELYSK